MTVKELIDRLKTFDPNIDVCGTGHFGEPLELYGLELDDQKNVSDGKPFVALSMQWAGNAPD